jgi:hypothetical protein
LICDYFETVLLAQGQHPELATNLFNSLNQETGLNITKVRKEKRKVSGAEGIKRLSLDTSLTTKTSRLEIGTARIEGATQ